MTRDFSKGHIPIDFPSQPFDSVGTLLVRSTRIFIANLPFLAAVTLAVYLPAKLALVLVFYLLDVPSEGILSYLLLDFADLVLGALVMPAAIYGLIARFRTAKPASVREALRWGRRQWAKNLWNRIKVEITVTLWGALLLIPGIVAMVKLVFTDAIVTVEADRTREVLRRSRELTRGHGWRIFFAILPALPLSLVHMVVTFRALQYSPFLMAPVDSLFSVVDHWMTVVVLLIYLGLAAGRPSHG